MKGMTQAQDILTFWFDEHDYTDWFGGSPAFDDEIRAKFADTHEAASRNELSAWRATPEGRLAEIIVLDQFSRQLHRGQARAFAQDGQALALAQEAVAQGLDDKLPPLRRQFLYLPFMHSESLAVHDEALKLYTKLGDENGLDYERRHREIIERFGRYPHRNAALGRVSTPEETAFLTQPGSSF